MSSSHQSKSKRDEFAPPADQPASRGASVKGGRAVSAWPATSLAGPGYRDPYADLSPTGRSILEAAHQLVRTHGFSGLSVGSVAKAAGENKSTVMYHFGDKAGLIAALTDSLIYSMRSTLLPFEKIVTAGRPDIPGLIEFHRRVALDTEYWLILYDLLPRIARDRQLQARFRALMDWYHEVVMRALGIYEEDGGNEAATLVASLMLAVLEGLALQRLLMGPRSLDLEQRFQLWESIITPVVQSIVSKHQVDGLAGDSRPGGTW